MVDNIQLPSTVEADLNALMTRFNALHTSKPNLTFYGNLPAKYSENAVSWIEWMHVTEGWLNELSKGLIEVDDNLADFINQYQAFLASLPATIREAFDEYIKPLEAAIDKLTFRLSDKTISRLNTHEIAAFSNTFAARIYQEMLIDPSTGYRYGVYATSQGGGLETLNIVEFDMYGRQRSTAKITNDGGMVLHGQYTQFDKFNNVASFIIPSNGQTYRYVYQPNTTTTSSALQPMHAIKETDVFTVSYEFETQRLYGYKNVFSAGGIDNTITFNEYDITGAKTLKLYDYEFTFTSEKGFLTQGVSPIAASAYLGKDVPGTLVFVTSGGMKSGTNDKYEMSIRIFYLNEGHIEQYAMIDRLDLTNTLSTSNTRLRDLLSKNRSGVEEEYGEIEGASHVKIGDDWVFTTMFFNGHDVPYWSTAVESGARVNSQIQLGFGKSDIVDKLRLREKPRFGIDYNVTSLSQLRLEGEYDISLYYVRHGQFDDIPVVLANDFDNIGGTGVTSAWLSVKTHPHENYVMQRLNFAVNSATSGATFYFERNIRFGTESGLTYPAQPGRWQLVTPIAHGFSIFSTITNLDQWVVGGVGRVFHTDDFSSSAPITGRMLVENSKESAVWLDRTYIKQTVTSLETGDVYHRILNIDAGVTTAKPYGVGGGGNLLSATAWVKLN